MDGMLMNNKFLLGEFVFVKKYTTDPRLYFIPARIDREVSFATPGKISVSINEIMIDFCSETGEGPTEVLVFGVNCYKLLEPTSFYIEVLRGLENDRVIHNLRLKQLNYRSHPSRDETQKSLERIENMILLLEKSLVSFSEFFEKEPQNGR